MKDLRLTTTPEPFSGVTFSDLMADAEFEVRTAARAYSDDPGKMKRIRISRIQNAIDILNIAMGSL